MAVEVRLVLDNELGDTTDPAVVVRTIQRGRILEVNRVPEACPGCHYTPYCTEWCSVKTFPVQFTKHYLDN
jgi:hypothetical protein